MLNLKTTVGFAFDGATLLRLKLIRRAFWLQAGEKKTYANVLSRAKRSGDKVSIILNNFRNFRLFHFFFLDFEIKMHEPMRSVFFSNAFFFLSFASIIIINATSFHLVNDDDSDCEMVFRSNIFRFKTTLISRIVMSAYLQPGTIFCICSNAA